MFRILIVFALVGLGGCQKFSNDYSEVGYNCGQLPGEQEQFDWIKIGNARSIGASPDQILAKSNTYGNLLISEQACVGIPKSEKSNAMDHLWVRFKGENKLYGVSVPLSELDPSQPVVNLQPIEVELLDFDCPVNDPDSGAYVSNQSFPLNFSFRGKGPILDLGKSEYRVGKTLVSSQSLAIRNDDDKINFPEYIPSGKHDVAVEFYDGFSDEAIFEKSCALVIDRDHPEVQLEKHSPNVIDLEPGQRLGFEIKDESKASFFGCLESLDVDQGGCENFEIMTLGLVTPIEGNWKLHYQAREIAGNHSPVYQQEIRVVDKDKLQIIDAGMTNGESLLKAGDPLAAALSILESNHLLDELKLDKEKQEREWRNLQNYTQLNLSIEENFRGSVNEQNALNTNPMRLEKISS